MLTARVKTLLRCLTAFDKLARRWPNQGDHQREMLERVVAPLDIEYIPENMLAFQEVPNLLSDQ